MHSFRLPDWPATNAARVEAAHAKDTNVGTVNFEVVPVVEVAPVVVVIWTACHSVLHFSQ